LYFPEKERICISLYFSGKGKIHFLFPGLKLYFSVAQIFPVVFVFFRIFLYLISGYNLYFSGLICIFLVLICISFPVTICIFYFSSLQFVFSFCVVFSFRFILCIFVFFLLPVYNLYFSFPI